MLPSINPGLHQKTGAVSSPPRSKTVDPGSTTSPRSESIRLTPRSPDSRPALNTALCMDDFKKIAKNFGRLKDEVQPDAKAARTSALPALIGKLQTKIEQSVLDAKECFTTDSFTACRLYLVAAKSNQVEMLGKIDDIPESALSGEKRTTLRAACTALGDRLTTMLLQARTQTSTATSETARKARDGDTDANDSPPGSPTAHQVVDKQVVDKQTRKAARHTLARESKKRAQGGAESPVLAETSPKRQKTGGISSPSGTATTATTTTTIGTSTSISTTSFTTTPAILASPPSYQPLPMLKAEQETRSSVTGAEDFPPGSPTSKSSPRKTRVISPQPKPRPRSQLFAAPPDFRTERSEDALLPGVKAAPSLPLPAMSDSGAAEATLANTDNAKRQQ